MSNSYTLDDMPLSYRLKQNGMTHNNLKRKCHVMFEGVWKKDTGAYSTWWGQSPEIIITRKKPTSKRLDPRIAIEGAFKDKDFIKEIEKAAKNAVSTMADYAKIKPGSKPIWTCIEIKRVTLHEEIIETEAIKTRKVAFINDVPPRKHERYGCMKYGFPEGSTIIHAI